MKAAIHPSAIVEDGARLGAGVEVGPFCHIGPQTTLGDGVRLLSHVSLAGNTTVGGRNDAWLTPSTPDATQFNDIGSQLLQTTNPAERLKLTAEGQQILLKDNYAFPLSNIAQVFGVSDNVKGLKLYATRYLDLYNVSLGSNGA